MMNQKRKTKVFNVTYDDGVLQDVRFVALLNKYNLKGTFNLNSGLMEREFEWTHESGRVIKRLSIEKAVPLYQGHEIACHTLTHPYMHDLSEQEILHELQEDKANLEKLFGREVKGFAVPFDYYSERDRKLRQAVRILLCAHLAREPLLCAANRLFQLESDRVPYRPGA